MKLLIIVWLSFYFDGLISSGLSGSALQEQSPSLYQQLNEEFLALNDRYSRQQLDNLLFEVRNFGQRVEDFRFELSGFDYGALMANMHLLKGHVFNSLSLHDSATVSFVRSAEYFATYTGYNGYFTSMANALQPLLDKGHYEEYLKQLDFHYRLANEYDPALEGLYKAVYLRFKLRAIQDHSEKLKVIQLLDSIFDNKLYTVKGLLQFRYYTDVLEYAHERGNVELIHRFEPKFVAELKHRGLGEGVEFFYRGYFALVAEQDNLAIEWLNRALELELSSDLENTSLNRLYIAHKRLGNWKEALHYFERVTERNQRLELEKAKIITADLIAQQQLKEANLALATIALEKKQIQSRFLVSIIALLVLGMLLFYEINKNKRIKLDHQYQKSRLEVLNKDREYLKHKILSKLALKEKGMNQAKKDNPQMQKLHATFDNHTHEIEHDDKDALDDYEKCNFLFLKALKRMATLSPKDCKMAIFLSEGYENRELESIFGISDQSVRAAKTRLKKKLKLNREEDLQKWLIALNKSIEEGNNPDTSIT